MPESLFLAIWILDKFLSKQEVERKDLQLVRYPSPTVVRLLCQSCCLGASDIVVALCLLPDSETCDQIPLLQDPMALPSR